MVKFPECKFYSTKFHPFKIFIVQIIKIIAFDMNPFAT